MRFIHTLIVATIFACLGFGIFLYKAAILDFPLSANKTAESWYIESKLEFMAHGKPVKAKMYLPRTSSNYAIVDENFISDGYGLVTKEEKETNNRVVQWSKRNSSGKEVIFYRAVLYDVTVTSDAEQVEGPKIKGLTYRDEIFKQKTQEDPLYLALASLIDELYARSADEETFVTELLKVIQEDKDERMIRIRGDLESAKEPHQFMATVLNYAAIPSRTMHGISLQDNQTNVRFIHWVEYFANGSWNVVIPEKSQIGFKEERLLPWWEGDSEFFQLNGANKGRVTLSVKRHTESALTEAIWQGSKLNELVYSISIFSLPIDVQLVFHVVLLVPLGALVMAFLRQVIGLKTFGTFMPVLIALAFRETQLVWGIVFFSIIVAFGLIFRAYFDKLHLLMAPRLTAILTVVVVVMFLISIIAFKMGISAGFSISLFPIVILTMVIERMTIMWEEVGMREALQTAFQSFIAAAIVYAVMYNDLINHWIITFPELLLVVLAMALLLGRYNGYKLTEYYRFKVLRNID